MSSPVPSVVHAFAIVRTLADGGAMTLSEVAQSCGISPSSCLGLLRTLVGEGVLSLGEGKRYALQPPWSDIAAGDLDRANRLITRARPVLERAARAWHAPVGLWRVVGRDRLQLVALGQSVAATRIHMEEGQRQPIGSGAVGRALAAAQRTGRDELARRFAAVRWQRPIDFATYAAQVAEAVRLGYGVDDGLSYAGITSVAVSLPDDGSTLCVSASIFAGSRSDAEYHDLVSGLQSLADEIAALDHKHAPSLRKARA
ncbi:transcriptional regulator, IclR family [Sphingomonas sp. OV641]|uniref:IclR family transcriptional regulator n=1 Tax=unclassified Sphingomonas TaxID=196159 RepID=UPI000832C135|nr:MULTISPECIES: helix-turn-helix domain-containing protein [unclassified Sphingomonas]SEJ18824.1 transcriptional regulator, IclR family [Sphingomonas sp. OV641]